MEIPKTENTRARSFKTFRNKFTGFNQLRTMYKETLATATRTSKSNRLNNQNNSSARALHFLYISWPSLHDKDMKFPNRTLF